MSPRSKRHHRIPARHEAKPAPIFPFRSSSDELLAKHEQAHARAPGAAGGSLLDFDGSDIAFGLVIGVMPISYLG